jgi:hypothetical protein
MLRFDPAKRITAREALSHTWLTGEVKDSPLSANVLDLMRSYNAEQRLRKIFLTVRAAVRFHSRKCGHNRVDEAVSHDSIVGLSALSIGSSSIGHGSDSTPGTSISASTTSRKAASSSYGQSGKGPSVKSTEGGSEGSRSRLVKTSSSRAEGATTPTTGLRPTTKLTSIVTTTNTTTLINGSESHGSPIPQAHLNSSSKTPTKSPLSMSLNSSSRPHQQQQHQQHQRGTGLTPKDPIGTPDRATQQRKNYSTASSSPHASTFHGTSSPATQQQQPRTLSSFSPLNEHEPKTSTYNHQKRSTIVTTDASSTNTTGTTVRGASSVQKAAAAKTASTGPRRVSTPSHGFRIGELK